MGRRPELAIPVITASFQANPTAKAIVYPGGQQLGNAATYMKAAERNRAKSSMSASTPARRSSRRSRAGGS
jgi:hypothetical protein